MSSRDIGCAVSLQLSDDCSAGLCSQSSVPEISVQSVSHIVAAAQIIHMDITDDPIIPFQGYGVIIGDFFLIAG